MRKRRYSPAVYYDNYVPDTLNRPIKDRPKRMERWSYLEKTSYSKTVWDNADILRYIKKHNEAPEGTTPKQIKELKSLKLISQRNGKLYLHKLSADYFQD